MIVLYAIVVTLFVTCLVFEALFLVNLFIFAWKDTPDTIPGEAGRDFRSVWGVNRPRVKNETNRV